MSGEAAAATSRPGLGLCSGSLCDVDAVELVRLAGANGFSGIMLPPFPRATEAEVERFPALLAEHGIRRVVLDGVMGGLPRCPFAVEQGWTLARHLDVARRFRADCFNVPHYSGDPATPVAELVAALAPLCERAERAGITVALEFLPGTGIPDLERALRLVERVGAPNLGITLDTWHWARTRATLAEVRALPKGVLKDFQISDRSAQQDAEPDSEQWGRLLPGEGVLPLAEIVDAVHANAPELTLNAEIFSQVLHAKPPAEAARAVARALSRIVAALVVLVFVSTTGLAPAATARESGREPHADQHADPGHEPPTDEHDATARREALARTIYEELIEIDTTHATGSTTRAAQAMAKRLRRAGFDERDVQVLGPERKGNLVARLRARTPSPSREKPLLLLAHLDVVAADPEGWSVEPMRLTQRDGYFWGRGTLDDKAMAAIYVTLAIELARSQTPLERDLILALTAGEEGGGDNGARWLVAERRDLVDAGLVINEGGHGALRDGKPLYLAVQSSEKTAMNFELVARDRGGHASRPRSSNAIYHLARVLARVEALVFPVRLDSITQAYLERLARVEHGELARAAATLARHPRDAQAAAALSREPTLNATIRSTCTPTLIQGGHAPNALPTEARVLVNCRALPGHPQAEIRGALVQAIADPSIEVVATRERESASPAVVDTAFLATVTRISESLWPGVPVIPTMGTGATDSTYFRRAGIPAYGVSGLFDDIDDYRAHGPDERLGVRQFYDGLEFLRRLVFTLAAPPTALDDLAPKATSTPPASIRSAGEKPTSR